MYLLMSTFLLNGYECQTLNNDTTLRKTSQFFLRNGIYKLKEMWRKIEDMGRNDNTVVGNVLSCYLLSLRMKTYHTIQERFTRIKLLMCLRYISR